MRGSQHITGAFQIDSAAVVRCVCGGGAPPVGSVGACVFVVLVLCSILHTRMTGTANGQRQTAAGIPTHLSPQPPPPQPPAQMLFSSLVGHHCHHPPAPPPSTPGRTGSAGSRKTSCAIRQRGQGQGANYQLLAPVRVRPLGLGPVSSEELGWAGCGPGGPTWPLGRWVWWPVTPTGTGAGSSAPPPYRRLPAGG
jgi:hypothetical protein